MRRIREEVEQREKDNSICWYCAHSVPCEDLHLGCEWSIKHEPVPGWRAEETTVHVCGARGYKSYLVTGCPKFRNDNEVQERHPMHTKAGFEEIIIALVQRALTDWDEFYAEMNRLIECKNIPSALAMGRELTDIDEWFESGCDGFISREASRKIIKRLHSSTDDGEPVLTENIRAMLSNDIQNELAHYITRKESKLAVADAYRKAEYEMGKTFKGDKKLCMICRKNSIKRCQECVFDWKGRPLS